MDKKQYMKDYNKKNREKLAKYREQWKKDNIEKIKKYNKQYHIDNKEELNKCSRQWHFDNPKKKKKYDEQWYEKNKRKRLQYIKQWRKEKYETDLKFNLNSKIKVVIGKSLKGNKEGKHWESLVGYSLDDLIQRLKQTMPKGYIWEDYLNGNLHIDHIIPIRAFVFSEPEDKEFKECWDLYNLRLLTKEKNLQKNDSINPILLYLLITGRE